MPSITTLISSLIAFFSLMLIFPAIVAFATSDWQALTTFIFLALAYIIFAYLMMLAMASRFERVDRRNIFLITIIMWLVFVIISIPAFIMIEGLGLVRAIFEAVSAGVTLGVSFQLLERTSPAMELYRSLVAWQGGLLTLLFAVYVMGRYQVGGTPNSQLRYILHTSQTGNPRILKTFLEVFVPYMALTVVFAALLVIVHTDPVDALMISLNVLSTNGYLPIETGASVLNNIAGEIFMIIFMIIGATSIIWHRTIFVKKKNFSQPQSEAFMFLAFIVVISIFAILGAIFLLDDNLTLGRAIINNIFDVVSIMTTTGITYDERFGISLPIGLILALAMVGGCSFSTSGGFKIFRLLAMFKHSLDEINRLVYPHLMIEKTAKEDAHGQKITKAIWSALFVAVLTIMVATLLFSINSFDLSSSLSLAVGAFSSTGNLVSMGLGLESGEAPSNMVLLLLSFISFIARIELLVLLAAISHLKW